MQTPAVLRLLCMTGLPGNRIEEKDIYRLNMDEAVGCVWLDVGVCAEDKKFRRVWMQQSRNADEWYICDFSATPQLKLWDVFGGVFGFVERRESCVVFGGSGFKAQ